MSAFLAGLVTGFGLIVAIGAQNVFVLRQGLARAHIMAVALTASLTDAVLITIGVAGIGSLIASNRIIATLAAAGGAIFLLAYGLLALRSAVRQTPVGTEAVAAPMRSARGAVAATLAVSLLNPHVYLDTVVLLGGIGGQLPVRERALFAIGAVSASLLWFFGLAFGARALAPLFERPLARRLLDSFVALVMFAVALMLIAGLLRR